MERERMSLFCNLIYLIVFLYQIIDTLITTNMVLIRKKIRFIMPVNLFRIFIIRKPISYYEEKYEKYYKVSKYLLFLAWIATPFSTFIVINSIILLLKRT